ncbi:MULTISPECIES: flavoprotein [unclassified Streptomyces]|uniref:flavoprotein n=1 Tax=unclassified Streptomyces TaxID=2593676 RepID=UPI001BE6DB6A|nr:MULTISPECIES: flavoprotein [unclassified Streptomyces]MBT2407681.1 flavoprotein [Streptomyces sp. ISL-21]MBT2454827.1 flavoprotein [Streptomyces sp. ISL-86]MBT2611637.1 flavoprotein [Streptomyces sp. ISL-87]
MTRTLYLFCSAAQPVFEVAHVIEDAQSRGWNVCLGLTPTAARWLAGSLDGLAALTGYPVRWEYKFPGEPDVWPPADALLFAPATFNSLNAWALGLTDRFTHGVAAESLGKGIPVVAMPCTNSALAAHPQFEQSLAVLRSAGVELLYGETGFTPGPAGPDGPAHFPWPAALDSVDRAGTAQP